MQQAQLPEYATQIAPGKIEVQAAGFYPLWLERLGVSEPDQYWLTIAQNCMKLEIQLRIEGTESAPKGGGALVISVKDSTKAPVTDPKDPIYSAQAYDEDNPAYRSKWALAAWPVGKGEKAAVSRREGAPQGMGTDAKLHFMRVMKAMPMGFDLAAALSNEAESSGAADSGTEGAGAE